MSPLIKASWFSLIIGLTMLSLLSTSLQFLDTTSLLESSLNAFTPLTVEESFSFPMSPLLFELEDGITRVSVSSTGGLIVKPVFLLIVLKVTSSSSDDSSFSSSPSGPEEESEIPFSTRSGDRAFTRSLPPSRSRLSTALGSVGVVLDGEEELGLWLLLDEEDKEEAPHDNDSVGAKVVGRIVSPFATPLLLQGL